MSPAVALLRGHRSYIQKAPYASVLNAPISLLFAKRQQGRDLKLLRARGLTSDYFVVSGDIPSYSFPRIGHLNITLK